MAGRVFAFADPQIIQLARDVFVPVSADDWYQRRRTDAEGRFWKQIVSQGPRLVDAPTHQGIYVFTADGELLAFKNAGQDANATREQLERGLRKWNSLPESRKKPGAVLIPDHGPLDPNYSRTPPEGGAIVRVHARILDRSSVGYQKGTCDFPGGDRAARDFLWLTSDEVRSLAAIPPAKGHTTTLPKSLVNRILRFHLVDNTRGEPEFWNRSEIRTANHRLFVTEATEFGHTIQFDGDAHLESASRGYLARMFGYVRIASDRSIDRFDLVAIGEHWGAGAFTKGERPGRNLLGITFQLADPSRPSDRIAPQGARNEREYYETR